MEIKTEDIQTQADTIRLGWYMDAGFAPDAVEDKFALRTAIGEALVEHGRVSNRTERRKNALTRAALTRIVFPGVLPSDEAVESAGEAERLAWKDLLGKVWNEVNPEHSKPVQAWVGENSPGSVLVKTTVQIDGEGRPVAYVTEDETLIMSDFAGPLEQAHYRSAEKLARNMAMIANRQPTLARRSQRVVETSTKSASASAKSAYQLALGAGATSTEQPVTA